MSTLGNSSIDTVVDWCDTVIGPIKLLTDYTRSHPGERASTLCIEASPGIGYIKIHSSEAAWAQEVHGYEHWAIAFGDFAPQLLCVRDEAPLAFAISSLPGKVLEEVELIPDQERAVWRAAGEALVALHELAPGKAFGPCNRDGTCVEPAIHDAVEYVTGKLQRNLDRGLRAGCLGETETAVVRAAMDLAPNFDGQRPVPCHRDYCPANWLVAEDGSWAGVIDFEFAHWDVRTADFSRFPDWNWIDRPDLIEAFFEGYGFRKTPESKGQHFVSLVAYGLAAIVWGNDNEYFGFAREGREALAHLDKQTWR